MALPQALEVFVRQRPLPVMVRGVLEHAFSPEVLDPIFEQFAQRQHHRKLLFSTCVSLMASVVTRVQPTLGAAICNHEPLLPVGRDCVYDKIAGLEDQVVAAALAGTAANLAQLVDAVGGALPALVPGLRTLVLDGNHLGAVDHRIQPLRGLQQAALPGNCMALLDADRKLFVAAFLQQDGHASEMLVLPEVVGFLKADDLLLADRNLCCRDFAAAIEERGAYFLIRQHGNRFPLELLGQRQYLGDSDTGRIYEQRAYYTINGQRQKVRRVSVELFKTSRNGDKVVHLLSNLPTSKVDGLTGQTLLIDGMIIAEGYRRRWSIETAFQTLTVALNCELNTLGYPPAALFGFCVAAMCYNAYNTAIAALRGHFGPLEVERKFSTYYMANEIRVVWEGMKIAVPEESWSALFGNLPTKKLAEILLELASHIDPRRYRKAPTRPKKPPTKGASKRAKSKHTSVIKEIKKHGKSR